MRLIQRLSALFIILMCAIAASAQSTQKVRLVEYRAQEGKIPMQGVEVVVGNAMAATSGDDGCCTLNFRSLRPGDKVLVRRIVCPGYVVFNHDALDNWRVSETSECLIVMCRQELIMELRGKYQTAVSQSLKKTFDLQKAKLDKELKSGDLSRDSYDSELDLLNNQHAVKLEEMEEVIEKFIFIDIEQITENEKRALDMLTQGDVTGAISAYELDDALIDNLREGQKKLAELNEEARALKEQLAESAAQRDIAYDKVKRHVALLRFQGGSDNIERSVRLLHDIAYSDTTNYRVLIDYANYCLKMGNFSEAEAALHYCAIAPDTIVRIQGDIVQSNINSRRNQHSRSVQKLELGLSHLRQLSVTRNAPTLYLGLRVQAAQALVAAYNSLRDSVNWFRVRQPLLDVAHRYHEQKNDNVSKRMLVEALYYGNCGHTNFGQDYDTQLEAYLEATRLQQELYDDDPTTQTAMLAFMHNALASTYHNLYAKKKADFSKVEEEYEKSIRLYEEAYQKNPKAYAGYLGGEYRSLANTLVDTGKDLDKVVPLLRNAERYIIEETRMSPETTRARFANLYITYMDYYRKTGDDEQCINAAIRAIDEALTVYEVSPRSSIGTLRRVYKVLIATLEKDTKNAQRAASYRRQAEEKGIKL